MHSYLQYYIVCIRDDIQGYEAFLQRTISIVYGFLTLPILGKEPLITSFMGLHLQSFKKIIFDIRKYTFLDSLGHSSKNITLILNPK